MKDGWYDLKILEVDNHDSASGTWYLRVRYQVVGGNHDGCTFVHLTRVLLTNMFHAGPVHWEYERLAEYAGLTSPELARTPDALIGVQVRAHYRETLWRDRMIPQISIRQLSCTDH